MATIKYDVSKVEAEGNVPKPSVYRAKITQAKLEKPEGKDARIAVRADITGPDKEAKGYTLRDWILLGRDDLEWKVAQIIRACGMPEKGELKLDKDDNVKGMLGVSVSVRTRVENSDEYGPQARPAAWLPLDGDDDDLKSDDENLDDDDDPTGDDDDDLWTEEELLELDKDELKEQAGEFEVTFPKRLTEAGKAKVIAAILEAQEKEASDDDADSDDDDDLTWDDLSEMDKDEIAEVIEENELEIKLTTGAGKKKKARDLDEVREEIAEALEIEVPDDDDDDSDDGDDDDDAPDYDEMDLDELKELAKERDLKVATIIKGKKTKAAREKALREALAKDDEPF